MELPINEGMEDFLREWIDISMLGRATVMPLQLYGMNDFVTECKTILCGNI